MDSQGTYGKVKLGTHISRDEKVAIKVIEKANIHSERQVARIQREIRFLKLLHHPHIVKVFKVHETTDQIFIIMEYVEGGELFDYIVSHKRVKEKEGRGFFRMMLSALNYCHSNAVIHRDLKPENLLLDNDKTIKIIDFGFGNTFKPHGLLDTYCGSPFYAAPEMILGKPYVGPEVDMWSLGIILYALLCGHLPFDDENIKELYKKIAAGDFKCPIHLSVSAKHLIQRLVTVDPKKRATLEEAMNHAWVNEGHSGPPYSYIPERILIRDLKTLDDDIIYRLNAFGYTKEEILNAFSEQCQSKPHPIRATYYLLKEMLDREEKRLKQHRALIPKLNSSGSTKESMFPISDSTMENSLYSIPEKEKDDETATTNLSSAISKSSGSNVQSQSKQRRSSTPEDYIKMNMQRAHLPVKTSLTTNPMKPPSIVLSTKVSSTEDTKEGPSSAPSTFNNQFNSSPSPTPKPELPSSPPTEKQRRFSLISLTTTVVKRRSSTTPTPTLTSPSTTAQKVNLDVSPESSLKPSTEIARTMSPWFLNVSTTSSKPPAVIMDELKRVLKEMEIDFVHESGFVVECTAKEQGLTFEIEICKVPRLQMHGIQFKRISGGIWAYKKTCNKMLQFVNL
ncbi:MAP/microtubule affinity-regulating kinase 3 [Coelomomyces lativittatus]|nr:MAP/microtubule affinity-regulating kinase 3 [Coelomomyces lativittatus]